MSRQSSAAERQPQAEPAISEPAPAAAPRPARSPAARRSARDLQNQVAAAAAAGAFDAWRGDRPDRWSTRRTLAFIIVTCSAFWICLGLAISRLS